MEQRHCTCFFMPPGDVRSDHSPDCMLKQPSPNGLLPCPWCGSSDLKQFAADGISYVQCLSCTSCGPDHKDGRHWNTRAAVDASAELWRVPADQFPDIPGCLRDLARISAVAEQPLLLAAAEELGDAYAEIRKQVFGSKVVFDRELCERAERAADETAPVRRLPGESEQHARERLAWEKYGPLGPPEETDAGK